VGIGLTCSVYRAQGNVACPPPCILKY